MFLSQPLDVPEGMRKDSDGAVIRQGVDDAFSDDGD